MVAPPTCSMSGHAALRAELRTQLRDQRKLRCADGKPAIPLHPALTARLLKARCVGGYCPTALEADALPILDWCHAHGVPTALPFIGARDAQMEFRRWSPGDPLERSAFAFRQPQAGSACIEPDLLLIPLLGFDASGNRLGQGAGHYDRYLDGHPGCTRVGLGFSWQQLGAIPVEPWDVPLESVATEQEFVNFCDAKD
jgi:5-formyltetrahydrofolate cyclo-ligase